MTFVVSEGKLTSELNWRKKVKIVIDTNEIKSAFVERSKLAWEKADAGHVLLGGICLVLSSYIVSTKLPKFFTKQSCCVDASIEKLNTTYPDTSTIPPKTKHAQLYNTGVKLNLSAKEFDCLSRNIYWESMNEPLLGQMSVAQVTYNRVLDGRWGNTFCEIVFAEKQFSWTNLKKIRNAVPKNKKKWDRAQHSAMLFNNGVRVAKLEKTQFYFADYIKAPKWSKDMTKTQKIGTHIFYAEK